MGFVEIGALSEWCADARGNGLQFTGLLRKFCLMMNMRANNGFHHLRRRLTEHPGWVAV